MRREHLHRTIFPLGELTKPQVRELATRAGLPVHRKKDSTGICFIGEREFRDFLGRYLQPDPGPIVDDRGRQVGTHQGLMYYTLGQRRGLGIGGRRDAREAPWYVVAKDASRNVLTASQDPSHPLLMSRRLRTAGFNWLASPPVSYTHLTLPTICSV